MIYGYSPAKIAEKAAERRISTEEYTAYVTNHHKTKRRRRSAARQEMRKLLGRPLKGEKK